MDSINATTRQLSACLLTQPVEHCKNIDLYLECKWCECIVAMCLYFLYRILEYTSEMFPLMHTLGSSCRNV